MNIDTYVLQTLYTAREPAIVQTFIWISEFGRSWFVYGIGGVIVLICVLKKQLANAAGLFIALAASGLGVLLLKGLVARPRPPQEFQAYLEIWHSFPSAHAALAATLYGFLAYLAWKHMRGLWRYIAISATGILLVLIAFSRLYLGVHYLTDVVAGVVLGLACMWLGIRWVNFAHKP